MSAREMRTERARGSVLTLLLGRLLLVGVVASASPLEAQVAMHREVPRGDVTGLEMGIEGSLEATPGTPLRWWITLFEVLHHRELRVASGCTVRAMASHDRAAALATVQTDAGGRAALEVPIGDTLDASTHLVLDATCPRGVRRLFDVDVTLEAREHVVLVFDRNGVAPAGSALAIGRVIDRATGRGVAGQAVDIDVRQGGPIGARRRVVTDAAGLFATRVEAGPETSAAPITVSAWTVHEGGAQASASASLRVAPLAAPRPLAVRVSTDTPVVAPGALVDLTVEVRGADGAPVEGALVSGPPRDPAPEAGPPLPEIRTDARGLAHHPWRIGRELSEGALSDVTTSVQITSAALGSETASASVRVARRAAFVSVAIAGGALVPGGPARVLARVLGPDGRPLAGRDVALVGEILGSVDGDPVATVRTDETGHVAFDVARVGEARTDECGGTTASQLALRVGSETTPLCVPVDPDAPITIRAPARVAPGASVTVSIARTSRATGRAVELTALRRGRQGWEPLAQRVVGAGDGSATLPASPLATGEIWLRARVIMADGQVVRGASALVSFTPSPHALGLEADAHGARVQGAGATDSVLVLAEGAAPGAAGQTDVAAALAGDIASDATLATLDGLALEAALAVQVPADLGASALLRAGVVVPQAMPEEPVALGLLRDPWRTRARFVRGRLGRIFLAVESMVEARIPERLAEVAANGPRGWTWNREMLGTAIGEAAIDDEGSATLDGSPLDIDALVALDPSFTFDHVAARITRARLFRVVRAIRYVTHDRNLDLPWARRGDPRTWIATLVGTSLEDGTNLETNDLFDAWGRAFVFRPTRRRAFLPAIEGWEVASLGPDGRDGTGDDVVDPFARVVPSGSLYADAVGEDALVARLGGVALGRSWIATLEEQLGEGGGEYWYEETTTLGPLAEAWNAAPTLLRAAPPAGGDVPVVEQPGALLGAARAHRWALPGQRRAYAAVAIAVPVEGRPQVVTRNFEAGAALSLRAELPEILRVGDTLALPLLASELVVGAPPRVAVETDGRGVTARLAELTRAESGLSTARLVLVAEAPGSAEIVLSASRGEGDDVETVTLRRRVRVVPPGALFVTHTSLLAQPAEAVSLLRGGSGGLSLGTTLTAVAPRGVDQLPFFAELARRAEDPAVATLAWSRTLEGELDAELAASAARATTGASSPLLDACALVALASTTEHSGSVATLRQRWSSTGLPADLRERAAILVALSGVASPALASGGSSDPVTAAWSELRGDGWRALASERSSPAVMARVAAGLLLADAGDGPGRALYRASLDALVQNEHEERVVPGDAGRVGDGWIGTLALAIAARQLGEDAVADELARAASRELYLLRRTGSEGAFWTLAASTFGALGAGERGLAPEVRTGLGLGESAVAAEVSPDAVAHPSAAAIVLLESRALREPDDRAEAPFDARVEGVLGDTDRLGIAGTRAALELVVTAGETDVAQPVVELELPSIARLDEVALGALSRSPAVASVSAPDRGGIVRIRLQPLRAQTSAHVPLVFAWLGAGRVRGLSLVAYDAPSPSRTTRHAGRTIVLGRVEGAGADRTTEEASR